MWVDIFGKTKICSQLTHILKFYLRNILTFLNRCDYMGTYREKYFMLGIFSVNIELYDY